MLPEISIGGEKFFDISGIVTPDRYARPTTDGLAIHHTVAQSDFGDYNANGTNQDEEIAHIKAINQYHIQQGYGGFGYNAIAFSTGRVYVVGTGNGGRAHVANHNNHLGGCALAGTFTNLAPPIGETLSAARWVKAMWVVYGIIPVKGHTQWTTDPAWATSCPGVKGLEAINKFIVPSAAALLRDTFKNALRANFEDANLEGLAAQIKFLTGGKFCG